MRLENKVTLLTGAAQGIGFVTAARFAREGAVVVIADIDAEKAAAAAKTIHEQTGAVVDSVQVDVSNAEDARRAVEQTVARHGRLDVLFNNAAYRKRIAFLDVTEEDWDRILDVCLKGCFLMSQAAGRVMVRQRSGSIINVSSVAGDRVLAFTTPYACAKAGLNMLTRVIATELGPYGVRANAIAPGWIVGTPGSRAQLDDESRLQRLVRTPLQRFGEPEDVAAAAVFFASDESRWISGNVFFVDGAYSAQGIPVPFNPSGS